MVASPKPPPYPHGRDESGPGSLPVAALRPSSMILQSAPSARSAGFVAKLFPTLVPLLVRVREGLFEDLEEAPHAELLRSFFSQGKLFRPLLTLVGAGVTGGDPARAVTMGQAIELFHGASLIHDDIIDEADTRRGRPAMHHALSRDIALVLGDYLILRALERLTEIEAVDGAHTMEAVRLVTRLVRRCCCGQIDELEASDKPVTESEYVSIVKNKTGALFATSLAGGALIAGASREQVDLLGRLGDHLGVIFQIYDDVLDIVGREADLGKPIGNSVAMQRPHIAWVYMAPQLAHAAQPTCRLDVLGHVQEHGVLQRIRELQSLHVKAAEQAIAELPPSELVVGLEQLTRHLASWADTPEP